MIEVFKTDVTFDRDAMQIIDIIQDYFPEYQVNFDLNDCDRILRIKSSQRIASIQILDLLASLGFAAMVLEDEIVT